jgi:hypothetical protein
MNLPEGTSQEDFDPTEPKYGQRDPDAEYRPEEEEDDDD